jgi:hypothetical protein
LPKVTELVDFVVTSLNTAPDGTWDTLTIGTTTDDYLKAEAALDPLQIFQTERKGLFVLPYEVEYDIAGSQGRRTITKLIKHPVVVVCMAVPFSVTDKVRKVDVSTWDGVKPILQLRERIDDYLTGLQWPGAAILNVTATPPQEIPMEVRWFSSATEFQLELAQCL